MATNQRLRTYINQLSLKSVTDVILLKMKWSTEFYLDITLPTA